jgi:putative transposase
MHPIYPIIVFLLSNMQLEHPQFYTATIKDWLHLLKPDKYKDIIIDSMKFMVGNKRVKIYGFVIMPNHIHIIWQILYPYKPSDVQRDFLKFIAQKILYDLKENHIQVLEKFISENKDRNHQIWKYNSLSIPLYSEKVLIQKLDYIHNNPIHEKWKLAIDITDYKYSSAKFYYKDRSDYPFLTHYLD